jgi:hypothetical protein
MEEASLVKARKLSSKAGLVNSFAKVLGDAIFRLRYIQNCCEAGSVADGTLDTVR